MLLMSRKVRRAGIEIGVVVPVAAIGALLAALVQPSVATGRQDRPARPLRASVDGGDYRPAQRLSRVVDGVRFSFEIPKCCWEQGPHMRVHGRFRDGKLLISESTVGPQGAEAVLFWTSFPDGDRADACGSLTSALVGPSAANLAAAVARAPGTKLVKGPSDVAVGGRPAKHVVLRVREDFGCDPGFFYTWWPRGPRGQCWGACWLESSESDTIRVWIVAVGGTRLFFEAATTKQGGSYSDKDIRQIVESIRFQ
jgi:hypothetical protein